MWFSNICAATNGPHTFAHQRPIRACTDYCTWAIQRKWERNDSRSYGLIKQRITYEYDLWAHGRRNYY